ncbi:uncharacterized protein LOC127882430 [Dreissena polymorpha]|uniref:uncharacterized protein LOC127882430 n=1 Tax=Dreissena polymorpha TaxID=45954 RepID=UPI0022640BE1|nr:uncharacterized protein LOC127882430 [Dreissena polymorpha]
MKKDRTHLQTDTSEDSLGAVRGLSQNSASKLSFENTPSIADTSINEKTSISETKDSANHGESEEVAFSPLFGSGGLNGLEENYASQSSQKRIYPRIHRSERNEAFLSDASPHVTYSQKVSAHTSTPLHENTFTRKGQLYGIERDLFGGESDINHDDIPAFSDIPYAMLLCDVYNKKELNIAIEKQQQKNILIDIKRHHFGGNDAAQIETKNQNRFLFSPKQETRTPAHAASKVPESGKIQMSNLKRTTRMFPKQELMKIIFNQNFGKKERNNLRRQTTLTIHRMIKSFLYKRSSVEMPNTDNCLIHTKAEISLATHTGLKSSSNQNKSPIKTSLEERVTSNGTKFIRKMSPTAPIAMDDNLPSSNLENGFESSQSTLNSPTTYKEERTHKYTHLPTNDKRVSVNTDKTQAKVLAHSREFSKSISETHDLDKSTNSDDGDDVDERDLPTAVKAFLISQGKRHPEQKDGDINIAIIIKQNRKSRHHGNASIQSTENVSTNEFSLQSNDSRREHDVLSQQSVHFEGKPDFMLKAERDVSERSETYARAFDALRTQQSSKKIKCIVCGNPDCQGDFTQNIQGLMHEARKQGLVVNDVPPDGNCMFTAVCDQLQTYNDLEYTARTLRETAVFWLQENPYCSDDSNTHFQAFMTENWDSYLQRMIKEGEWGDHVILRAVANITGRKIKILSVNGKTSSWTSVEPSSKQPEQIPAILLGHVGESHYTSLRHNDSPEENVSAELIDEKSILLVTDKVTGDEDHTIVASFLKDHVDIESKIPMCCLSFLMTSVLPVKTLVGGAARLSSSSLQKWTQNANAWQQYRGHYPTVITGSIADGIYSSTLCTFYEHPDVKYNWMDLTILYECPPPERVNCKLVGHGTICSAGHTYVHNDKNEYELSEKFSVYTFTIPTDDNNHVDAFYVMHWPYWPEEASEWIKRVRYVSWPPEEVIHDISSLGCHLIPEAHVSSTEPFKEWKFCFATAQTALFRNAMSVHQKYCFLVANGMCFEVLNSLLYFKLEWIINPFLYCCERCPSEFWESNYGACVTMIIDEIRRCFTLKHLPNYFIPAWNMIGTLDDFDISAVVGSLENLRAEPLLVLRQLDENFKAIPDAETTYNKVKTASEQFLGSKITTLNVFVPCMIDIAKYNINKGCYDLALESMNEAYQTRLSVATCEDAMSYEIFIQECFSGLTTTGKIWFATYVDKQLQGQLSRTLIQQVMEGCPMKKICEILEKDISGYYGPSEVPVSMAIHFDNFCHDYAMFLVLVHKVSDALPILYDCHKRYQHYLKIGEDFHKFSDETMLAVYSGIFALHKRQQHTDVFREILEDASSTVARVNQSRGYTWLAHVHRMFKNENEVKTNEEKREELLQQLPGNRPENNAASLMRWPMHYIM